MAAGNLGPYTLQFPYIVSGFSHVLEVSCDVLGNPTPGDSPADVEMRTRGTTPNSLNDFANDLWDKVRPLFSIETLATTYTLFKRNVDNANKDFVSGGVLLNPSGTVVSAPGLSSQAIFTWRTIGGQGMKIVLLEGAFPSQTARTPITGNANATIAALNTYILGDANSVMARDRTFPVVGVNASFGQNEKIFKRRNRS